MAIWKNLKGILGKAPLPHWIVEVENPDGAILYVAAIEEGELPHVAEEHVQRKLGLPRGTIVMIYRQLSTQEALEFNLSAGEIVGPM